MTDEGTEEVDPLTSMIAATVGFAVENVNAEGLDDLVRVAHRVEAAARVAGVDLADRAQARAMFLGTILDKTVALAIFPEVAYNDFTVSQHRAVAGMAQYAAAARVAASREDEER